MEAKDRRLRDKKVAGQLVPAATFRSEEGDIVPIPAEVVAAVQLAIRGYTWVEIARRMGKATKTVSGWMQRYGDYVDSQYRTLCAVNELVNPLVPDALRVYRQALKDGDTRVAGDVLDRAMGKPVVRVAEEGHQRIEINIQSYPGSVPSAPEHN